MQNIDSKGHAYVKEGAAVLIRPEAAAIPQSIEGLSLSLLACSANAHFRRFVGRTCKYKLSNERTLSASLFCPIDHSN